MPTLESFYSVTITATNLAAPSDGFIDHTPVEVYGDAASPTYPATLAASEEKKRANWRNNFINQQLQLMGNVYKADITTPGADANTPPTSFVFVAEVERGDEVLTTPDELNAGQYLTGAAAIKRCVARALCEGRASLECAVFDPTTTVGYGNLVTPAVPAMRVGQRVEVLTIGALFTDIPSAEATIAVAKVA